MSKLTILLVTRNRISACIDALNSIKRIVLATYQLPFTITVCIQDNSDHHLPSSIINYFRKYIEIHYHKTNDVLPMSANWNEGISNSLQKDFDYLLVLADRRLLSLNAIHLISYAKANLPSFPFICFDHQSVWLNSKHLLAKNYSYNIYKFPRDLLLEAFSTSSIDWKHPMLFNCLISRDYLLECFTKYSSHSEGSSPDMNFLARVIFNNFPDYYLFDAPCIITNARQVLTSNGTIATQRGTIHDTEHGQINQIEAYPPYMTNFMTANIIGSLERYIKAPKIDTYINSSGFFFHSLAELSYPKSRESYEEMKKSLLNYVRDRNLSKEFDHKIYATPHTPSAQQIYPIEAHSDLSNTPRLNLLSHIEKPPNPTTLQYPS